MPLRRRSLLRLAAGAALLAGRCAVRGHESGSDSGAPRDGARFRNPGGILPPGLGALLRWQLARAPGDALRLLPPGGRRLSRARGGF